MFHSSHKFIWPKVYIFSSVIKAFKITVLKPMAIWVKLNAQIPINVLSCTIKQHSILERKLLTYNLKQALKLNLPANLLYLEIYGFKNSQLQ